MKPDISIYGSVHRPENWISLIESIGENEVSWDITFVGPNPPIYEMPENFKFIQSFVKPTQCLEIAARMTTADLIMNLPDDVLFRTPNPLDKLYQTFLEQKNKKIMVSCRFMLHGQDCSVGPLCCHRFYFNDQTSPMMAVSCFMSRKYYMELGGIDRKFIAVFWDSDLCMRVHASGGEVILSDVYLDEVLAMAQGHFVGKEYWDHDRIGLFLCMWTIPGTRTITFERSLPFEPFSDERIL